MEWSSIKFKWEAVCNANDKARGMGQPNSFGVPKLHYKPQTLWMELQELVFALLDFVFGVMVLFPGFSFLKMKWLLCATFFIL